MGGRVWVGCCWLAFGCLWVAAARAADTKATIEALRKAGKPKEALTVVEAAIRNAPSVDQAWPYVSLADQIVYGELPPAERAAYYKHVVADFADRPGFYLFGATLYIETLCRSGDPALRNPVLGAEVSAKAVEQLKDFKPRDHYYMIRLFGARLMALAMSKQIEPAKAWAAEISNTVPQALTNRFFHNGLMEYGLAVGTPEALMGAARTVYVLSDYSEAEVKLALQRVTTALTAVDGPGAALQFAKAQEDPAVANPLKRFPALVLGDPEAMLSAAGDNYTARFAVLLHTDKLAEAVALAKRQMTRSATNPAGLAQSLKDLARCFRARDLSLVRANRFLEFNRTGDGENPLPVLEAELKPAAGQ